MALSVSKYFTAGYPVIYLRTGEQERALQELIFDLKQNGLDSQLELYVWKITKGLYPYLCDDPSSDRVANDLMESLNHIAHGMGGEPKADRLYVFFNIRELLRSPGMLQQFRDTAYAIRTVGSYIVCIGGGYDVPEELEDVITFVDFDLPTKEEIKGIFKSIVGKYQVALKMETPTEKELMVAAENATGLSAFKAENAIALSLVEKQCIDIDLLRHEKQIAVKQSGVIEFLPHGENLDTLGGFEVLKDHVGKRRKYFRDTQKAADFGLRPPKGILMVGVAGTGKTLAGKAIASTLGLPLYKFDMGSIFKGVVGQSEATVRQALKLAETVAPCVLLFDEFEKTFTGMQSSGKTDSGVTSRVIQQILTWMQETKAPVYKVATCNSIKDLDSALFRRGRWDSVFAVDLPTLEDRRDIFAIHLAKRGRRPEDFDLQLLAEASEQFVGAEIESVVEDALFAAYDDDRDVTTDDLQIVCKGLVPIAKTDQEAINDFRRWMDGRATPVSARRSGQAEKRERSLRLNGTPLN